MGIAARPLAARPGGVRIEDGVAEPCRGRRFIGMVLMPFFTAGCAMAPLDEGGSLASYSDLTQADGLLAKSKLRISKDAVLAAKTVRIVPTVFAGAASHDTISEDQRKLVANA
ncbi:MAG: hypothetical protein B7Y61_20525, partial [Rhizobiales bacterium 35-66-30]